ncbi:MAG: PqqD family protein [Gemmatimonadaceae bacterium]
MNERCTIPHEVACAQVDDGAVILHMGTKRYFSLNETGAEIWRLLEDDVAIADIPRRLRERYDVTLDEARASVTELITTLSAQGLLAVESA